MPIIIIGLLGLILFNLIKQISLALQAGGRLDKEADSLTTLQQENERLNKRLSEVNTYDFVEQTARDKLNMSKPNETVVVIPEEAIQSVLNAQKKPEIIDLPNWQGWLRLIFH